MFRDVLEVEKLRTGAEPVAQRPVEADELVEAAVGRLHDDAAAQGVTLERIVAPHLMPHCDKERILKVLLHLIENAVRASPRGAPVVVEASARGDAVLFSVTDRGAGIDPREWPYLFEEAWRDPHRKGDGLGLSVCRAIVEAHGGRIWCESRLGQGTTFRFVLPRSELRASA